MAGAQVAAWAKYVIMNLWRFIKTSWWKMFAMCLFLVICWLYVDQINEFIASKLSCAVKPEEIYEAIQKSFLLNAVLSIGVIVGFVRLLFRKLKDKFFSFSRVTFSLVLIILLFFQDKWEYAVTIIPFVEYNFLIASGALLYVVLSLVVFLIGVCKGKGQRKEKNLSLLSDSEGRIIISESREKYATLLAERLLRTDISKEAFAIGVAGEWGSGKTLFLNAVENALNDKAFIVKFNPWNSQNEKHLTKDFLDTLSQSLSPFYSGIASPIRQYASLLYSLRIHVASDYILQYIPKSEERDLASKKKSVEGALSKIGKPVVVFIDDIDRLEGNEILEVLRIIRNTAVFRNMVYVVAYDKEHVVSQLSRLEIGNGSDYLEKIFQIEIQIPKPDERMLIEEFKNACRSMTKYTTLFNSLFDKLNEDEYQKMAKVLTSFRKAKRFARQFSFNANYMLDNFTDRVFELSDLLFLSLIQYQNSALFKTLWQNPIYLLDTKKHNSTQTMYYCWPKENDKEKAKYDPISTSLMENLFSGIPDAKSHSIQFADLFYKYFYLAQPEQELSSQDFLDMLKMPVSRGIKDGMMAAIRGWVSSKENKSINSIYHLFVNYDTVHKTSFQKCANYLHAVFYWLEFENRGSAHLKELLPRVLVKSRFPETMKDSIKDLVNTMVMTYADNKKYLNAALVLSELYRRLDKGDKLLLDIKIVEKALERNTELFLNSNAWDPISLYENDGNFMRTVVDAYCVPLKSYFGKKKNLAINQVMEYYQMPEHQSNSYVRAKNYIQVIPSSLIYGDGSDHDFGDLSQTFGDEYRVLAVEMLKTCFTGV